jgi:hypothetical protein
MNIVRRIAVVLALLLGVGLLVLFVGPGEVLPERTAAPHGAVELENSAAPELAPDSQRAASRRASLEVRWRNARSIAVEKWRADLLTANAVGEIGAVPPMLTVRETGAQVQLTNRGAAPLCVALARVTRPNTDAVRRCQVGPADCSLVKPRATIRLQLLRTDARESCTHAAFEYRVGHVDFPEPSWWSRTAINTFNDPPQDIDYKQDADLETDIARFEATVEDADRAARWRHELAQ